jgi:hypothetical protein
MIVALELLTYLLVRDNSSTFEVNCQHQRTPLWKVFGSQLNRRHAFGWI